MEIVSFGKTRAELIREKNVDIVITYCRMRHSCGRGGTRCPLAVICGRHPLGYLITDFTDAEISEALELIAQNGGFKV